MRRYLPLSHLRACSPAHSLPLMRSQWGDSGTTVMASTKGTTRARCAQASSHLGRCRYGSRTIIWIDGRVLYGLAWYPFMLWYAMDSFFGVVCYGFLLWCGMLWFHYGMVWYGMTWYGRASPHQDSTAPRQKERSTPTLPRNWTKQPRNPWRGVRCGGMACEEGGGVGGTSD